MAGKRQVYNVQLMAHADYNNIATLKRLICSMPHLESLAERGDTVALSILVDLKTVMGAYGLEKCLLSKRQARVVYLLCIEGWSQWEVALELDVTQRTVSNILNKALRKMRKQLLRGNKLAELYRRS